MARYEVPNYPFVQARHVGGSQRPTAVSISLSRTTSEKGAALGIANYHHGSGAPCLSYHFIVDEDSIYRCVPLNVASYGTPYRAINILLCGEPQTDASQWGYGSTEKVTKLAAGLVAELMMAYKIPKRNLKGEARERWYDHRWRRRGGLIIRVPGAWPHKSFMLDVDSRRLT